LAALSFSAAVPAPAQTPRTTDVQIEIVGLREARGLVRLCLTRDSKSFPDCKGPQSIHATLNAGTGPLRYRFHAVPVGAYAVVAFHDANGDGKLNKMLKIPTEGFAFSRNPKMHARAPRFDEVSFQTDGRPIVPIRMKYLF
jgi:uncharacterized protein (DUF2141 family)